MIDLMFPLTDPLKHIHSAIVLTLLQLMVQDWTYTPYSQMADTREKTGA